MPSDLWREAVYCWWCRRPIAEPALSYYMQGYLCFMHPTCAGIVSDLERKEGRVCAE